MQQTELETTGVSWRDYLELCKPNVVALMILTSLIGMLLATDGLVSLDVLILGNLGIALCAGSAAAVNHIVDRKIDDTMARTHNRPIARGRIQPSQAIMFAALTGLAGMVILLVFINQITAWLTLASSIGCLCLHHVFKARDAAKYCYRRFGWRSAPAAGLDCSDRRSALQRPAVGTDYLRLDTAALLGVGDPPQRRLCQG